MTPEAHAETVRKAECSRCGGLRNCEIRGRHNKHESSEDGEFWGNTTWYILECRGCEHVFAQTISTNSEDTEQWDGPNGPEGGHIETIQYWPALSKRPRPEWMSAYGITEGVYGLDDSLLELYGALDSGLNMLAAIGIRTCFDVASELLGIEPALTFAEKLDALVEAKHIRLVDRSRLETAVEAGNATTHRGWKPKASDLDAMATVLEDFVFGAFVQPHQRRILDAKAAKVRISVPERIPRRKKVKESKPK